MMMNDAARIGTKAGDVLKDTDPALRSRAKKAPNAFRTISEVADDLHIPQHVLRFWETKFPQVNPLKRGGGRRYYRPDDIVLLRRIADLLYTQGYTIKGVQRLLREGGGQLSDDIPPPTADERAAAEAEKAGRPVDNAPLIPGLELASTPPALTQMVRVISRARHDGENERLRSLLEEALGELEALRARLEHNVMVRTAFPDPVIMRFRAELHEMYGSRLDRVVLFGSRERGDVHHDYDYDVAVFLRDMDDRYVEMNRLADLSTDICNETGASIQAMPYPAGSRR